MCQIQEKRQLAPTEQSINLMASEFLIPQTALARMNLDNPFLCGAQEVRAWKGISELLIAKKPNDFLSHYRLSETHTPTFEVF
jgi:hypothetical protein